MVPKEYPPTMAQSAQTVDNVTGTAPNKVDQDYSQSTAHTSTAYQYNWCPHKLPCGWCSYMSRPCVKGDLSGPTITWTSANGTAGTPVKAPAFDGATTVIIDDNTKGAVHGGEV